MNRYASPLRICLKSSRMMLCAITIIHLLALVAGLDNGLALPVKAVLIITIITSFFYGLEKNRREKRIFGYGDSGWYVESKTGKSRSVSLMGSSVATPLFIFLHLKSEQSTPFSFLIFQDSVNTESYRRLRILLTIVGTK
ncbi:MAG: protein YgfX [Methylococcales bacterium]